MKADTVLYNGEVYTVDTDTVWAQALAIHGPTITAVGGNEQILALAGPATRRINLGGRLVLPGLCDAHIHMYDWTLSRLQVRLSGSRDKEEMLDRIGRRTEETEPGGWIVGRGWNETSWPERSLPTRHDLDRATGRDRPAIFWRSCMHCAVANSAALSLAGIDSDTGDPDGGRIGRDANGDPNGLLWELAVNLVCDRLPHPQNDTLAAALIESIEMLHRMGITAVHDQRMKDQTEGPRMLETYQRLRRQQRLSLRVNCNVAAHDLNHLEALGLSGGFGDDYLRLGHVKFFADGSLGSRTAWMLEEYADRNTKGICVTSPAEMAQQMARAIRLGFPISVHAIGDRANREVLDVLEELRRQSIAGTASLPAPHRIEHVQVIHPDDIHRLAAAGLTASVQPMHVLDDMAMTQEALSARANRAYNFRSLVESGALLALGSDAPVADPNPFLGFHAALTRRRLDDEKNQSWNARERLDLEEVVEGYTLGAAKAAGWEDTIGSITPGKRADLVVLDRDLFSLAGDTFGDAVAETSVVMTIFDGQVVYAGDGF